MYLSITYKWGLMYVFKKEISLILYGVKILKKNWWNHWRLFGKKKTLFHHGVHHCCKMKYLSELEEESIYSYRFWYFLRPNRKSVHYSNYLTSCSDFWFIFKQRGGYMPLSVLLSLLVYLFETLLDCLWSFSSTCLFLSLYFESPHPSHSFVNWFSVCVQGILSAAKSVLTS